MALNRLAVSLASRCVKQSSSCRISMQTPSFILTSLIVPLFFLKTLTLPTPHPHPPRRIRTHSLSLAATRSLSTSTSSSSSAAAGGGEDGAAAAESLAGAAAEACSSSSSSAFFLLPDASAPVAAAASLLDSIGPNSNSLISLPWWAAIPTAAVAVRAALLPLSVAQARSAAAFGPLMQKAREEEEEEKEEEEKRLAEAAAKDEERDDSKTGERQQQQSQRRPPLPTVATLLRRLLRLREQTSTPHPCWLLLSPLMQIPVFASAVLGVRAMANAGWPGFSDGGALWFPDLTARAVEIIASSSASSVASSASVATSSLASLTAPMGVSGGILPALVAAGTLAAAAAAFRKAGGAAAHPAAAAAPSSTRPQEALRLLLEWLTLPAFVGSLLLPQGAVLYWASSSGAALAQGAMLRSRGVREMLGLREIAERAARGGGGRKRSAGETEAEAAANAAASDEALLLSSSTPPAALAHLSRAAELRAAGHIDRAIRAASAAVEASGNKSARAWFALGQLRATAAHWHDAELAFGECGRLEEEEARGGSEETEAKEDFRSRKKHEVARALFGAGVAQSMQGDREAASDTLRRAVAAAEVAFGGKGAVEAEVEKRRKRTTTAKAKKTKSSSSKETLPPLPPPLATLARSLLALASSLDAQGKTLDALAVARRAAGLDAGAERMAVAPLVEKLRKEEREREAREGGKL